MPKHGYILNIGANMVVFDCCCNLQNELGQIARRTQQWSRYAQELTVRRRTSRTWLISDECSGTSTKVVFFTPHSSAHPLRNHQMKVHSRHVDSALVIRFNWSFLSLVGTFGEVNVVWFSHGPLNKSPQRRQRRTRCSEDLTALDNQLTFGDVPILRSLGVISAWIHQNKVI